MVYNKSKIPLYLKIHDILQNRIANNEYEIGELIPTELELANEFQVSRVTIRKALDVLKADGYIRKKAGYGTIVLKKEDISNFTLVRSVSTHIDELGKTFETTKLSVNLINPTLEQQELFRLDSSARLYKIIRIRSTSYGKPVILSEIYLKSAVKIYRGDIDNGLYNFLGRCGVSFSKYNEHITAVIGQSEILSELQMENGSALLKRTRFSYSEDSLIEYSINYYNPNLYEYRTNFFVNSKDKNKEEK